MTEGFGVGFVVGLIVALPASMLSVLLVAMWRRRPLRVAISAAAGGVTSDAALAVVGIALGSAIASVVTDAGLRATISAGFLVGVAGRIAFGLLVGPYGVAHGAVLPTTMAGAWARFLIVALINPTIGVAAAAVGVSRPDLAAGDAWTGLVVGFIAAGSTWRVLWAATAAGRRGVRLARTGQLGLGITAILAIAWLVFRLAG